MARRTKSAPDPVDPLDDIIARIQALGISAERVGGLVAITEPGMSRAMRHQADVASLTKYYQRASKSVRVTCDAGPIGMPHLRSDDYAWDKRFSAAWLGRVVNWPDDKRPTLEFGVRLSFDLSEIAAVPGDVVRCGRKDYRDDEFSRSWWAVVQPDGSLRYIDAVEARRLWDATQRAGGLA